MQVQTAAAGLDKPLLQQTDNRFTLLPVWCVPVLSMLVFKISIHDTYLSLLSYPFRSDQEAFEFYKKAQASYWTVEEVNLSEDIRDWGTLSPEAQHFISTVLAFFVVSDGIVLENLAFRFMQGEVNSYFSILHRRRFYFQATSPSFSVFFQQM